MKNAPRLYDAVFVMLGQQRQWRDVRHLKTLVWMVVGLLLSGNISLTDWLDYGSTFAPRGLCGCFPLSVLVLELKQSLLAFSGL